MNKGSLESSVNAVSDGDFGGCKGGAVSLDEEAAFSVGDLLHLGEGWSGRRGGGGGWRSVWRLRRWRWGGLPSLLASNLQPEWDRRWASRLGSQDVWCRWGTASLCRRGKLRDGGGGLLIKGAHLRLKSVEALVCAATRGLGVFDCRTEFVPLREVVGLDLCKISGDYGDKGVHAGVFLGGSHSCKPLNPVGLWVCLAGEAREIGGVAARAFCCGGVGCER